MESTHKPKLSNRLNLFSESQTIAMAKAGRALAAEGKPVINLSFGEPDFDTPAFIKDAAKQALDDGYTKYTPVAGLPELKEAIVHKFKRDNNLTYTTNQIVVSTGAKHAIMNVILALINEGDEVVIPAPYWVSYSDMVQFAGGTPVYIETSIDSDFKINPKQLSAAITEKTKLFIFSSPSNPSGSIYNHDELAGLVTIFEKHPSVFIISDEIYEHINYVGKHVSMASFTSIYNQVITINGFSKGFAMTGWRLGYLAAHPDIAYACEKIQGQFTSGANAMTQKAAVTALRDDLSETIKMANAFKVRRDLVVLELREIEGLKVNEPEGAFYVFPDVSYYFGKSYHGNKIENSMDLCFYLLNDAFVTLVSGDAFGAPNYIRFSYAASTDVLLTACQRIKEALYKLQ